MSDFEDGELLSDNDAGGQFLQRRRREALFDSEFGDEGAVVKRDSSKEFQFVEFGGDVRNRIVRDVEIDQGFHLTDFGRERGDSVLSHVQKGELFEQADGCWEGGNFVVVCSKVD